MKILLNSPWLKSTGTSFPRWSFSRANCHPASDVFSPPQRRSRSRFLSFWNICHCCRVVVGMGELNSTKCYNYKNNYWIQLRKELIGPEIEDPVLPLADPQEIMGRRLFGDSLGSDAIQSDRCLDPKPFFHSIVPREVHGGVGFFVLVCMLTFKSVYTSRALVCKCKAFWQVLFARICFFHS